MDKEMNVIRLLGWFDYSSGKEDLLDKKKCGKWMYFFKAQDQEFAKMICQKAINEEIVYECKCTDIEFTNTDEGVICFYLNEDDTENHRRVIQFMLNNDLIRKTKTGKLYNISFKLDNQTRAGEYGDSFESKLKLEHFVNLLTGEFIR